MRLVKLKEGQAIVLRKKNIGCLKIKCCRCGLGHLMFVEITKKGYMKIRFIRDGR